MDMGKPGEVWTGETQLMILKYLRIHGDLGYYVLVFDNIESMTGMGVELLDVFGKMKSECMLCTRNKMKEY